MAGLEHEYVCNCVFWILIFTEENNVVNVLNVI